MLDQQKLSEASTDAARGAAEARADTLPAASPPAAASAPLSTNGLAVSDTGVVKPTPAAKARRSAKRGDVEAPSDTEEPQQVPTASTVASDPDEGGQDAVAEGEIPLEVAGVNTGLVVGGAVLGLGLIAALAGGGGSGASNAPPTAVADTAAATEGGATVTGSVAVNDSDADADPLTFALVAPVAGLMLNANGSYSFDPSNAVYNGLKAGQTQTVTANYTVSDGKGGSAASTLTITMTGTNDGPTAVADTAAATEGGAAVTGSVAGNDSDPDGDALTYALAAPVAGLTLNTNGSYSFDPSNAAYNGLKAGQTQTVTANYTVSDGQGGSAASTLTITVTGTNDGPTAAADTGPAAIEGAAAVSGSVAGNDSDPDGDALTYALAAPVAGLTLNANGGYSFDPANAAYNGLKAGQTQTVTANYTVSDGQGGTATSTLTFVVTGTNDGPTAAVDTAAAAEGAAAVTGSLATNDSDPDGDVLTYSLNSPVAGLTLNANGSYSFDPAHAAYNGLKAGQTQTVTANYTVSDGQGGTATSTLTLTVTGANDGPIAAADTVSATEGAAAVTGSVAGNDSDPDGDPLTYALNAPVAGLTLNANGGYSFDPANAAYNGLKAGQTQTVTANYTVSDGQGGTATSTLTFVVTGTNDGPTAAVDTAAAAEGAAAVTGTVATNDSDPDGDILTYSLNAPVAGLTLNANGSYSFNPANAAYNGLKAGQTQTVTANYTVSDGQGGTATSTLTITVTGTNDGPTAAADTGPAATEGAAAVTGSVAANDSDPDGDSLTYALNAPVAGLTLNANGGYSFDPANAAYNGLKAGQTQTVTANYTVSDGQGGTATSTLTFVVTGTNDAPLAVVNAYTVAEDAVLTVAAAGVLANDADPDGDPLTAALVAGPANGTLALNANGSFVYTPNANYAGPDSFTYRVNDGTVNGNTVTVSLTVTPVNDAPVSTGDAFAATEDTPLTVAVGAGVLANDTDVDGNPLTAVLVAGPTNGTLVLNANGSFTYTPTANYAGADSFTYKGNDGTADGNTVTVNLSVAAVNDAPVGVADSYTTGEDAALTVAGPGVLGNDTDVEGSALTAVLVTGPANGTLALNANGGFLYTPNADWAGADSFTYQPNDGTGNGAPVTVSLTVTAANDAPAVSGLQGDVAAFTQAGPAVRLDAGGNAGLTDVDSANLDGGTVTVSITSNGAPAQDVLGVGAFGLITTGGSAVFYSGLQIGVMSGGSNGTDLVITLTADATPARVQELLRALTYLNTEATTPSTALRGISVTVTDGDGGATTVTSSVDVNLLNAAPVATGETYAATEDTPLTVAAGSGVLANDTDADGNPLTAVLVTGPANGTLILNPDGSFTYTPNVNFNGTDSFTYAPNDGTEAGNTVTVTMNVAAVNDAPAGAADNYTTAEDAPLTVTAAGVLTNDTDAEGSGLSAVLVSGPTHGVLSLNANGGFDYTPTANYSGTDIFTYRPNDGTVDGSPVTVTLTVTAVNDAPTTVADAYAVNEDAVLTVAAAGVLANDTDIDGGGLSAVLVSNVAHGTLALNANGGFVYTPNPNYSGADSFTYKANDGTADGNTVTVNLTVNAANDPPVANDDTAAAGEDIALSVSAASGVLANDTDVDPGATLTVSAVAGGAVGSQFVLGSGALLTLNADGSYVYNPNSQFEALRPGQTATDSFSYTASDGNGGSDTATVTVTIAGANEVPDAAADTYSGITGNTPYAVNAAAGLLANDADPDQPASGLSVSHVNGVATGGSIAVTGGSVVVNGDGSFVFTPATGFQGAASFSYTLTDADGGMDTATVTLNVAGQIWYVDNNYAGANGASDGSYLKPFTSLTQLNGVTGDGTTNDDVDAANDTIFVYNTGLTYTGGITLEAGQKLFGDGHEFTVNGINIGAGGVVSGPTINHSTYGVTLATGNEVRGLTFNGTAASAVGIQDGGGTVGSLTVSGVSVTGTGKAIDIDQGGALDVSLNQLISSGSSSEGVDLQGVSGTLTVSGTTTVADSVGDALVISGSSVNATFGGKLTVLNDAAGANGSGAFLSTNTGTYNFNGGVDITVNGTGAYGFRAQSSGTVNIADPGANNQITSNNGTAILINPTTFNATLASVTSGGGADGISLTGMSGALTIGTVSINGQTDDGIDITNSAGSVTINGGSIGNSNDPSDRGVMIAGGTGAVTIAASITKTTAGTGVEVFNHETGNVTFSGAVTTTGGVGTGIVVTDTNSGTVSFTGQTAITSGSFAGVLLQNNSGGTITFSAGGNGLDVTTTSGAGLTFTGGGTLNITGTGNTVSTGTGQILNLANGSVGASGITFQTLANSTEGAASAIGIDNLDGNTFSGGAVTIAGTTGATSDGISIVGGSSTAFTFASATINNVGGDGIELNGANGAVTFGAVAIGSAAGTGVAGHGVNIVGATNAVNINGGAIGGTNDPAGDGVNITGGTGTVTVASSITKTTAGNVVEVNNHETGNVTFSGTISATGGVNNGILLTDINSGTVSFTGQTTLSTGANQGVTLTNNDGGAVVFNAGGTGLDVTTTSGTAFSVVGGGTVTVQGAGNSFNAGAGGTALSARGDADATGVGNATISSNAALTGAGRAADIQSYSGGSVTLSGNISNTGTGVLVSTNTGGTFDFTGGTKTINTGANAAVTLTSNTGATINFTGGGLDIDTTTGAGLTATGGGAVTVQGTGNSITAVGGTALNVTNTTIGGSGLTFHDISANGGSGAVILNNTGTLAGLTVTGDNNQTVVNGTNSSGGIIQNVNGVGISLTNTANLSFTNVHILNTQRSGVWGTEVNNFTFQNGRIDGSGLAHTAAAQSDGNIAFNDTTTFTQNNVRGIVKVSENVLNNSYAHGLVIQNYNGTIADLTVTNNSLTSSTAAADSVGTAVLVATFGTSSGSANLTKATIDANFIRNFPGNAGIFVVGGNSDATGPGGTIGVAGSATNIINITNNDIAGESATNRINTQGIATGVQGGNSGSRSQGNFNISSNSVSHTTGHSIDANTTGYSTSTVSITGNTVNSNNIFSSSGITGGIGAVAAAGGQTTLMTATVSGNNVSNTNGAGIRFVNFDTAGTLNLHILNNLVNAPTGFTQYGVRVDSGNTGVGEDATVNLEIRGNTLTGTAPSGGGTAYGIGLRKQGTDPSVHSFSLEGYVGDGSAASVTAYVNSQNPNGNGTLLISAQSGFTGIADVPLLAATVGSSDFDAGTSPTQVELEMLVEAAIQRWIAAGASEAQVATMRAVSISLGDSAGLYLGSSNSGRIMIDADAAGHGWFIDATPGEDEEFANGLALLDGTVAGRMDLLTVIAHELGHQLGLHDLYGAGAGGDLMHGYLQAGERRLPEAGEPDAVAGESPMGLTGWVDGLVFDDDAGVTGWVSAMVPEANEPDAGAGGSTLGVMGWIDGIAFEDDAGPGGVSAMIPAASEPYAAPGGSTMGVAGWIAGIVLDNGAQDALNLDHLVGPRGHFDAATMSPVVGLEASMLGVFETGHTPLV